MLELLQQAFEVYKNGGDVALEEWYTALPPKKKKQYTHEVSTSVIAIKKGLESAKEYLDKFAAAQPVRAADVKPRRAVKAKSRKASRG